MCEHNLSFIDDLEVAKGKMLKDCIARMVTRRKVKIGKNILACRSGKHQITITSRRSSDKTTKENKRKGMHEDCYKVVGGNNPGWTFLNNNLPKEEEETESVELTKDGRIEELEGLLKLEKDKSKMEKKDHQISTKVLTHTLSTIRKTTRRNSQNKSKKILK